MMEAIAIKEAAIEGGKVAMKYFRHKFDIMHKGKIDLVTEADIAVEKKVQEILYKHYPKYGFLAEEASANSGTLEKPLGKYWVVDPIDGTTNFAHGFSEFSISIGLVEGDEVIMGVVFKPYTKDMYFAIQGEGATLNNSRISVSKTSELIKSLLITGFPYERNIFMEKTLESVNVLAGEVQGIRRFGSAALDLAYVAEGTCDGFFEYTIKPWDVSAGILLVREAGGKVTNIAGEEADPFSGNFIATNGLLHEQLMERMAKL